MQEGDATLVRRARRGDRPAFGQLLVRHSDQAMHLAQRMVGRECAREMVQEGALQAMLSLDRLGRDEAFGSWFCGIVLNLCRNHLRRRSRELSWEDLVGGAEAAPPPLVAGEPSPQERVEALETHDRVLAAVEALSPKIRRAALLFYFEQLQVREIAALLDISAGAVKGRLFKARRELADRLWPLYAELRDIDERKTDMTQVEIADVVPVQAQQNFSVTLLDRAGKRKFFMTIGHFEGSALALFLRGQSLPRPVTPQLTANILDALGAELAQVRIEKLEQEVFYAVVVVKSGDEVKELDARPSDAMCIAALKGAPIYATDAVWEKAGRECSDDEIAQMGQSLAGQGDEVIKRFASIPVTYEALAENPGAGQEVRLEIARFGAAAAVLDACQVGDSLPVEGGPAWLYLDGVPRFVGAPVTIDGMAGTILVTTAPEGAGAAVDPGERRVSVELGRGWVDWPTGAPGENWPGAALKLPQALNDESVQVWVDDALWATGTLHIADEGQMFKIVALA